MKHFGIICPATSGHLNSILPLGQELQKRGHRVTLFGVLDVEAKVLKAGLNFWPLGVSEYPIGSVAYHAIRQGELSERAALRYTVNWATKAAEMLLKEAPPAMKKAAIDALIADQVSLAGGSIAEFIDIPLISFCSTPPMNQEDSVPPYVTNWQYSPAWWARVRNRAGYTLLNRIGQPIRQVINDYRRKWKLTPYSHPNDAYSMLLQISQEAAEFEFPREHLPACFHFTGPYHNSANREPVPFPFEKLTGQPLIYASMGTIQNRSIGVFHNIASACEGLDAQLVISLGGGISREDLPKLPGSPLVVGYAPQLELLQRASLTITHAGLNTALESLSFGVPMVAIPVTNDQPGVAARLAWTGAGEVVPLARLSVAQLQVAIALVLNQSSYKQNALRLQSAIHRAGGVSRAAELVEKAISIEKHSSPNSFFT